MAETLYIEVIDQAGGQGAPATSPQQGPSAPTQPQPERPEARGPSAPEQPRPRGPEARGASAGDVRGAVEQGGAIAQQAAGGDLLGAAARGIQTAARSLGPVGTAALGVTAALGAAAIGVVAFTRAMSSQVEQLAQFSGQISAALVQSNLALQQAQIRRAERVGPDLAAFERLWSRFEVAFTDLGTSVIEALLTIVRLLEPALDFFAEFVEANAIAIREILRIIKARLKIEDEEPEGDPLVDLFLKEFKGNQPELFAEIEAAAGAL